MTVTVIRDQSAPMKHVVHVRSHSFPTDAGRAGGGEDAGPDPHDLYDAALGACTALTVLWYANRKGIPVGAIEVAVERDTGSHPPGVYRLRAELALGGPLDEAQRHELLGVAEKCPIHKLMTQVVTEIETVLKPWPNDR
jgi:putative redox protein